MHSLFVTDLSVYMNSTYSLVPGQLLNVDVVPGSILVGFDIAASSDPAAPLQSAVIKALNEAIASGSIDIGYPFPLAVDPVSRFIAIYSMIPTNNR